MLRLVLRFLVLSMLWGDCAFGQGTFGQIAYGGGWQTTFTLINMSADSAASGKLTFYGNDGSTLTDATVQGAAGNGSSFRFTIPQNGVTTVVLSSTDPRVTEGWAVMSDVNVTVRGQGSFSYQKSADTIFEAVVPLSTSRSTDCILPFPPSPNPVILVPFDNTGDHATAVAFANTTPDVLIFPVEFYDEDHQPLGNGPVSLKLASMHHKAFYTADTTAYSMWPMLMGRKGILRISASPASLTVLGLLFNGTGAFTTIIPVIP